MPRIIIFAPYAFSGGHHETDLEMAASHVAKGDEVHVVQCRRELASCDPNPDHKLIPCLVCHSSSCRSFRALGLPQTQLHSLNLNPLVDSALIPEFKTIEDLKAFCFGDLPAGMAVASSLITVTRDSGPEMHRYRDFVVNGIKMFVAVHQSVTELIGRVSPDVFYVFNGRSIVLQAAFLAARKKGVQVWVGERDHYQEYVLIDNASGVDREHAKKWIAELQAKMPSDPKALEVANSWFTRNRQGNKEQLCNYVADQSLGKLPDGFDPTKRNISIFISSENEVAAVPGWNNPLYGDQSLALKEILKAVTDPHIHFYIRGHPNLKGLMNAQTKELGKLSAPNATLIPAASPIDSYALMEASRTVVTFGSTMGIEATYWNRPSILVGRAFYEDLGACYAPKTREELYQLLRKDLTPLPREKALPYGYWWRRRPQVFRYVTPKDPQGHAPARFAGKDILAAPWVYFVIRWVDRVKRALGALQAFAFCFRRIGKFKEDLS